MAKTTPITTKDCSPFENIPAKSSEAIKKLSEYFIKTYPDSKNDDLLVSFRTFQNTNKEVETAWRAGKPVAITACRVCHRTPWQRRTAQESGILSH